MPYNNLNDNEFNTYTKFDVIETQNGANISLTPTPSQQKIIDRLKNLLQQKDSTPIPHTTKIITTVKYLRMIMINHYPVHIIAVKNLLKQKLNHTKTFLFFISTYTPYSFMLRSYVFSYMHSTMHLISLQYQRVNSKVSLILILVSPIFIPLVAHIQQLRKVVPYYIYLINSTSNHEQILKFIKTKNLSLHSLKL